MKKEFYKEVGDIVSSYRNFKKITQKELALRITPCVRTGTKKLSRATIVSWEKGNTPIPFYELFLICKELDIDINKDIIENLSSK